MNEPIASGREAGIFALDAGRVPRRHHRVADVTGEAAVMTHVAAQGHPVPVVHPAQGSDLVRDRLDGPTRAQAMTMTPTEPAALGTAAQRVRGDR